jgi:hypothetical protein
MRKKILTITAVTGCVIAAVLGQASHADAAVIARSAPAHSGLPAVVSLPGAPAQSPAGASANTSLTFTVTVGALSITAPASANLGAANPGNTIGPTPLGAVTVTDNRAALNAGWTATASSTDFTTGGGTTPETIPANDVTYTPGTPVTTGTVTDTATTITLSGAPQSVVTATAIVGDNTGSWDPNLTVAVPGAAVGGAYTATLTHSVS